MIPNHSGNACRRLLIDGVWQVPASERPHGWESMGGKEPTVKVTAERTETKTVERISVEVAPAPPHVEAQEVVAQPETKTIVAGPQSPLPDEWHRADEFYERCLNLYGGPAEDDLNGEEWDAVVLLAEDLTDYRKAKVIADELMTSWASRHARTLRQIGVGSKPIKDLWEMMCREVHQRCRLERAIRAEMRSRKGKDPYGAEALENLLKGLPETK